jgi:hypothetical protein
MSMVTWSSSRFLLSLTMHDTQFSIYLYVVNRETLCINKYLSTKGEFACSFCCSVMKYEFFCNWPKLILLILIPTATNMSKQDTAVRVNKINFLFQFTLCCGWLVNILENMAVPIFKAKWLTSSPDPLFRILLSDWWVCGYQLSQSALRCLLRTNYFNFILKESREQYWDNEKALSWSFQLNLYLLSYRIHIHWQNAWFPLWPRPISIGPGQFRICTLDTAMFSEMVVYMSIMKRYHWRMEKLLTTNCHENLKTYINSLYCICAVMILSARWWQNGKTVRSSRKPWPMK